MAGWWAGLGKAGQGWAQLGWAKSLNSSSKINNLKPDQARSTETVQSTNESDTKVQKQEEAPTVLPPQESKQCTKSLQNQIVTVMTTPSSMNETTKNSSKKPALQLSPYLNRRSAGVAAQAPIRSGQDSQR